MTSNDRTIDPMKTDGRPAGALPLIGCGNEENRHAWVRSTLGKIAAGKRILDAGAGTQPYRDACRHLIYVAQDFARYDGTGDQRGLQTGEFNYGQLDIVSDLTAIPEPDQAFDAVLCTEVLEHVPSPETALREFARILKQGGDLILTAPFVSFTHFAPYHYCTGFNRYFYEVHLASLGFEVVELAANGSFFDLLAQEMRRVDHVAARYAGARLGIVARIARKLFLRRLEELRSVDRGSSEFACYGLHLHARRRAPA